MKLSSSNSICGIMSVITEKDFGLIAIVFVKNIFCQRHTMQVYMQYNTVYINSNALTRLDFRQMW